MDNHAAQALIRFGLGRRGSELLPADPAAWLLNQLGGPDPGPAGPSLADGFAALRQDNQARRDRKADQAAAQGGGQAAPQAGTQAAPTPAAADASQPAERPHATRDLFKGEIDALVDQALTTQTPFRERLVWFWANHFTVSVRAGRTAAVIGDFVRTAIRPNVTGSFHDMLLAVMRHPAMLMYLDNGRSFGPTSVAGLRQNKGLNENLARESLELHTVSTASGYSQADVTNYAKILTGWSVSPGQDGSAAGFMFRPQMHEPGEQAVLGQSFPPDEAGGLAALAFLAQHPATYRHLATKLVRHFVADAPSDAAVQAVAAVLHDTGGNLGAAAAALVKLPQAWQPLTKLRTPQDLVLATLRAADLPADKRPDGAAIMRGLGQPMFDAPFPIGWPDTAADWAGPEAMVRRVDWAYGFAGRADMLDPASVAEVSLGPLLTDDTGQAIRRAGSRRDGLTLLFTSPEFQRR